VHAHKFQLDPDSILVIRGLLTYLNDPEWSV
jgi:hypothetical protein